jgi:acetoin utilization protein AcuB
MRLKETASGWMTDDPVTLAPDRPVIEAYALMIGHGVRHLPVMKAGNLVGMISDRDLQRATRLDRARKPGDIAHLFSTPVSDIMTRERFVTIDPLTSLGEAAALMVGEDVHALLVLDGERLVGILTTHDILRAVTGRAAPSRPEVAAAGKEL